MANRLKVEIAETVEELKQQLKHQKKGQQKERLQMLYWLKSGQVKTRQELAKRLARNESTIYRWLQKYQQGGLTKLLEVKVAPGIESKIKGQVLEQLQQKLSQPEGFESYRAIQSWLAKLCGVEIGYSTVHRIVRYQLKAKLKVPRPRSLKTTEQQQQTYKKKMPELIQVMTKHFAVERPVRYFCSDESRWGLKTLTGRVITLMGIKPVIEVQWPRDSFWLYGAVEPLTGQNFFYAFSHLDATCFNLFVTQFSAAFPDTLNLLQLDQASAHISGEVHWPDNVVPLFQPSHSPELNPIERFWQDLRKDFKGRNFSNLISLQQALFNAVNSLSLEKVASLTSYSFILDALSI